MGLLSVFLFFHYFFLLDPGLFLFSGQIQSLLEFLPGGNWIFWGNSRCSWISPSDVWISRLKKLYFPPRGIAFPPNQSGEIRFSLVGNLGKITFFVRFSSNWKYSGGNLRFREFPQEKFPFSPGEIPISPIPVWRNFLCRFPLFWSTKMETDRKNQLGKKNFNFDPLGASSILGLDREILNKTCFKQLSLKPSQEMSILLFGIKQFNLKIMPAKFHPIL